MSSSTILFLSQWQDLLGSILGVLGAFLMTLFGLFLNHIYQKYTELRENTRRLEISLALALNNIYDAEQHLKDFLRRLDKAVLEPLKIKQDQNQYFLNKTNFPHLEIHLDSNLLKAKYKSYYIHNKILFIHKNILQTNEIFKEMKEEYEKILENVNFLISQKATPQNQQAEYLSHNTSFKIYVEEIINQLDEAKKHLARTKIFNLKVLNREILSVWRLEGITFKFFRNNDEIKQYRSTLKCLDRIDFIIEPEVEKVLCEATARQESFSS